MEYETLKLLHQIAVTLFVVTMAISFIVLMRLPSRPERAPAIARKTRRFVTVPGGIALLVVWGLGIWMLIESGWWQAPWMWAKLVVAFIVSGLHGAASKQMRLAANGTPLHARRPGSALVGLLIGTAIVVGLVIAKPF